MNKLLKAIYHISLASVIISVIEGLLNDSSKKIS